MDRLSPITLGAALKKTAGMAAASVQEAIGDFADGITLKGSVDYTSSLPDSGNEVGDEYIVKYSGTSGTNALGKKFVWDGSEWVENGISMGYYLDGDGDVCQEG